MFYQILLSPQVKRQEIVTYKHGIYELSHKLPNNFSPMGGLNAHTRKKKKRLRKLGNNRKLSKLQQQKSLEKQKLNFSRCALFLPEFAVSPKYSVSCFRRQPQKNHNSSALLHRALPNIKYVMEINRKKRRVDLDYQIQKETLSMKYLTHV